MLNTAHIGWAKSHDWFVRDNGNGTIEVSDRWSQLHPDGKVTHHEQQIHWTRSFAALRDWAGY